MTCFVLKTSSQQNPFIKKSEPFSKPFAKLSPTAVFLSHRFLNSFIEVYDVAHLGLVPLLAPICS